MFKKSPDGGYEVTFPSIIGGVTCGDDFEDAKHMAEDLLKLMLTQAPKQCFEPKPKDEMLKLFPEFEIVEISVDI